jgi:hypothetical protein
VSGREGLSKERARRERLSEERARREREGSQRDRGVTRPGRPARAPAGLSEERAQ